MKTLKQKYEEEIKAALKTKLELKNDLQIPRLEKIVINYGLGQDASNGKALENAVRELSEIACQKPVITRAKKSISGFKLREKSAVGVKVTLRKERMYAFFTKLVDLSMPRIRDFQGISPKGFDKRGNYTFGLKEQLIFPEVNYDKIDAIRGMDITFVTTATNDNDGKALLEALGMPFKKPKGSQR